MTTNHPPAVPWPTLMEDFTCGGSGSADDAAGGEAFSCGTGAAKQQQQHSPSNPQAPPKSAFVPASARTLNWGPSHSTEDDSLLGDGLLNQHANANANASNDGGGGTEGGIRGGTGADGSGGSSSGNRTNPNQGDEQDNSNDDNENGDSNRRPSMERIWERAGSLRRKIMTTELSFADLGDACLAVSPCVGGVRATTENLLGVGAAANRSTTPTTASGSSSSSSSSSSGKNAKNKDNNTSQAPPPPPVLGISPMRPPSDDLAVSRQVPGKKKGQLAAASATPTPPIGGLRPIREHEEIEVLPNHKVQVRLPPTDHHPAGENGGKKRRKVPVPVATLQINSDMAELERSISELTMRSSYAAGSESLNKIPDNRRMAYYAVGKHHRQSGRGGNRRCYFTGKLILGGSPFYAGSVQQGLRTLVVFCLPSALGMPNKADVQKAKQAANNHRSGPFGLMSSVMGSVVPTSMSVASTTASPTSPLTLQGLHHPPTRQQSRASSKSSLVYSWQDSHSRLGGAGAAAVTRGGTMMSGNGSARRYGNGAASVASKSMSRLSSLDDLSLSIDGDLDPNWGLDKDYLLSVLPEADAGVLKQMEELYPEQFETLPIQVRDPKKWKLYVKFCFFSGLPIAEGEMHYKVRDDIADQVYGEEIVLSHEVMEAVNGESAEILTLPNQKAFRYLRKHYTQQCSKLDERVFRRNCWERVAPEV